MPLSRPAVASSATGQPAALGAAVCVSGPGQNAAASFSASASNRASVTRAAARSNGPHGRSMRIERRPALGHSHRAARSPGRRTWRRRLRPSNRSRSETRDKAWPASRQRTAYGPMAPASAPQEGCSRITAWSPKGLVIAEDQCLNRPVATQAERRRNAGPSERLRNAASISRVSRSVAQPGRAPRSGRGGRRFKSCRSDQFSGSKDNSTRQVSRQIFLVSRGASLSGHGLARLP